MEIRFKPELGAKLAESGALQGRNPEELVEEVVSHYFDEESQLIEAVTRGEGPCSAPNISLMRKWASVWEPVGLYPARRI